jgi:hypothetical protein
VPEGVGCVDAGLMLDELGPGRGDAAGGAEEAPDVRRFEELGGLLGVEFEVPAEEGDGDAGVGEQVEKVGRDRRPALRGGVGGRAGSGGTIGSGDGMTGLSGQVGGRVGLDHGGMMGPDREKSTGFVRSCVK